MKTNRKYLWCVIITLVVQYPMILISQVTSPEVQNRHNTNQPSSSSNTIKAGDLEVPVLSPRADEAFSKLDASDFLELYSNIRNNAFRNNRYDIPEQNQKELDIVLEKLGTAFPNSFEYHYAAWLNGRLDTSMAHHLLSAAAMEPDRTEIYSDLVALYELKADIAGKRSWCAKLEQKKVYDPSLYQYARNLFRSLEKGAYVFTRGEWDTYPLWVLQHIHKERPDVTVLQLDMLHRQHYFERMMKPFRLKKSAYRLFLNNKPAFFRELAAATGKNNQVYLSLTLDRYILQGVSDILYNTGLAMKLSNKPFNNISVLAENFKGFDLSSTTTKVKNYDLNKMNGNYIMPLGLLYKNALENNRAGEAEALRQKMLTLARQAGMLKEMEEYLKTTP